jgi:F-box/WD-40 domain protein MET30
MLETTPTHVVELILSYDQQEISAWDIFSHHLYYSIRARDCVVYTSTPNFIFANTVYASVSPIHVHDYNTGDKIVELEGHDLAVLCFARISSTQFVSGGADNSIKGWDIEQGVQLFSLEGHYGSIRALLFKDNILFSASEDKSIKLWSIDSKTCTKTISGHKEAITLLSNHDGNLLSASTDGMIVIWNREYEASRTIKPHNDSEVLGTISRDANSLISYDRISIRLFDFKKDCETFSCPGSHAILIDSDTIASVNDNALNIHGLREGGLKKAIVGHKTKIKGMLYHKLKLITCSNDATIKFWDIFTSSCEATINCPRPVLSMYEEHKNY